MKKIKFLILCVFGVFMLSGCQISLGTNFYASYADADKYSVGGFTYKADEIRAVEINWIGGEIEIVQSENAELSVTENSESLDSEKQVHHYIREGKLIIHYCESGHIGKISSKYKKLSMEIPAGIDLDIDNVSANIKLGDMNVVDFELTNVSGNVNFAGITAEKDIDIEIVSGKISAQSICAKAFEVKGVSGDIDVSEISADEIDVEIVSGKTQLALAKPAGIEISGVSGNVSITLPENNGAVAVFNTVSGKLSSDIEHTKTGGIYTFRGGETKINVETVSGNLYIK